MTKQSVIIELLLRNCFSQQDKKNEALNAYQKALALDGNDFKTHFQIADLYFSMENSIKACEHWKKSFELGYEIASESINKNCK